MNQQQQRVIDALSRVVDQPETVKYKNTTKQGLDTFAFTLKGDQVQNCGRAMVLAKGTIAIWHMNLPNGLGLEQPFQPRNIAGWNGRGPTKGHEISLSDLEQQPFGCIGRPRLKTIAAPAVAIGSDRIEDAAMRDLTLRGWEFKGVSNGVHKANDGSGSSSACRLVVQDNLALAWSMRNNIELDHPWREGKATKTGERLWYATGRDLVGQKLDTLPLPGVTRATAMHQKPDLESLQKLYAEQIADSLDCPANHRHLMKNVAQGKPGLSANDLKVVAPGKRYAGAIIVPLLRPPGENCKFALELCGAQALLSDKSARPDTDKVFFPGSQVVGAFLPWPPPSASSAWFAGWIDKANKEPEKPLVLCEGIATAMAVHESGAGHAICCFSSSNVGPVARWLKEFEHGKTNGIVIAADNDIGLHRDGTLKSKAVPNAISVARELDIKIAFPGKSFRVGDDARDLYACGGASQVRRYIERAASPDEVETRFNNAVESRRLPLLDREKVDERAR